LVVTTDLPPTASTFIDSIIINTGQSFLTSITTIGAIVNCAQGHAIAIAAILGAGWTGACSVDALFPSFAGFPAATFSCLYAGDSAAFLVEQANKVGISITALL
jgi:hypothetical protein